MSTDKHSHTHTHTHIITYNTHTHTHFEHDQHAFKDWSVVKDTFACLTQPFNITKV